MVEKFKKIMENLIASKGQLYLFAILKMDEVIDKWTVIISALWIQEDNMNESFILISDTIVSYLSEEELSEVANVGVFLLEEHIVQDLLKYKAGTKITEDERVNGNIVYKGYILASGKAER